MLTSAASVPFAIVGPTALHPHKPAGMTLVTEVDFGIGPPSVEAGWQTNGDQRLTAPYPDPVMPRLVGQIGGGQSGRLDYTGIRQGTGPITTTFDPGGAIHYGKEIYVDFDYLWESDYRSHPSGTMSKIWFNCGGTTAGGCPGIIKGLAPTFAPNDPIEYTVIPKLCWHMEGGVPNVGGNSSSGARVASGGPSVPRDVRMWAEYYMRINSAADVPDGRVTAWVSIDGNVPTLAFDALNCCMWGTGSKMGPGDFIRQFKWAPTYGGNNAAQLGGDGHTRCGYVSVWSSFVM